MFFFRIKRIVGLGVKSLWLHRMRSILTILGIIFGVCSVIAMLAIGEGASRQAQEAIRELGSTNLIIETVEPADTEADSGEEQQVLNYGLTYKDAESIRNAIADVEVVVPIRQIDNEARYRSRKAAVKIIGTVPWYTEIAPVRLLRGRFLASADLHNQLTICVIDEDAAERIFLFEDPIGKDIRMQGAYFRVVGLVEGSSMSRSVDNFSDTAAPASAGAVVGNVYVPLTTARFRFSELVASFSGGNQKIAKVELQKITVKVTSTGDVIPMRDILAALLDRLHDKQDYRIVVPLQLLRQAAQTRRIFSIVLGSIAAISLLVGGIGIMNIMLATVSERTREIGIRRALGARKHDIIIQFLSETLILTLLGGIVGILVGSIIPFMVTFFGHMPTVITAGSLILSFGISAAIGIIFGLYPAYLAANMDPIESLRHE